MDTSKEVVILNRDNEFALFLMSQGNPLTEMGTITRVTIEINGTLIDSDVVGSSVIWWTDSEEWRAGDTRPVVKFKLGGQTLDVGIARGCTVVTYDPVNTSGIEWTRNLVVEVKS